MYYVFMQMLSSGPAWLSIILLITVSLLPDVIKKVLCRAMCPTATERAQGGGQTCGPSARACSGFPGRGSPTTLLGQKRQFEAQTLG
uniref:Uncharacterized protein n=1 Tax=Hippocampus comes TaxID=109280 RepID=A0A3Q2YM95_HIPCM